MLLFKRNKKKDDDRANSYWCAVKKKRVGYDVLNCQDAKQISAAKKKGYTENIKELLNDAKDNKKRNIEASTESSEGGDSELTG